VSQANVENNLIKHLNAEIMGCTYLVLWLDNDREGENICFEVIDIVQANMPKRPHQQIFRAKFSSITRKDIIQSFESLSEYPNKNESTRV
jgi:DNA topoisomerase-3